MKHSYLEFHKLYPSFISLMIKKTTTDENRSHSVNIFFYYLKVFLYKRVFIKHFIYKYIVPLFIKIKSHTFAKENPIKERNRMNIKNTLAKKKKA